MRPFSPHPLLAFVDCTFKGTCRNTITWNYINSFPDYSGDSQKAWNWKAQARLYLGKCTGYSRNHPAHSLRNRIPDSLHMPCNFSTLPGLELAAGSGTSQNRNQTTHNRSESFPGESLGKRGPSALRRGMGPAWLPWALGPVSWASGAGARKRQGAKADPSKQQLLFAPRK